MSIPSDHKALIFVGTVAVLGAAVRVARAVAGSRNAPPQPGLEHQIQAADSAARAGRSRTRGRSSRGRAARTDPSQSGGAEFSNRLRPSPILDRPGYVGSRLDLDVATAAQIDSLPGMSPSISKRIVADRMEHGPFTSLARLTRVKGVTTKLLQKLDTLVVFSGTITAPNPGDSVIPKASRAGKRG